ncbi:DUF551 domain-containing protein [Klebsiella pneumoniae]|uniref:DUF551 domain-containing protein n=1 Tax=Klebsiella pneumoniae TaxID=573 RepID=UPI00330D8C74|nr:DUF551 domain-containing protein [Klebsiella pneumoniae]HDH0467799.1 DUF551 domain-containing protein [Klebsiella pneumoniae]
MSEFSRETLLNIIETDHVQCGEASALASMALAAMDSEPVAEVLSNRQGNDTSTIDRVLPIGTQLYRHAQQPVVPEDIPDSVYEILCQACGGNAWMYSDALWNACRATMLAAAQHDTPALNSVQSVVTVPGKWIPVSERMPEVGDIVLTAMGGSVNIGEMECSAANCRFFTSVISGRELPATHWMPLPASPQEVK